MALAVKRFDSILTDMSNWIIANQDKVTDFNEGSIIRSLCEAVGLEIEELYIRARVGFGKELKEVPFYAFNFERGGAQESSGEVVFSRTGTSGTVDIPIGTLVATEDGMQYETTETGQITSGNTDSASIDILATEAGKDRNVPADTIVVIVTPVVGVETVNNAAATTGGQDQETESEYLQRFREMIEGLGNSNNSGLIAAAKSVDGVRSASTVEHFPPSSSYNVTVYIDDGAGNASQALIDEVEALLVGDGTEANPGYKAGGINLRVLAPTKVNVNVTVEITDDGTISQEAMTYLLEQAISDYINNLLIGEDVIVNKLIEAMMAVDGVVDLDLTAPSSNVTVTSGQIARTNVVTITYV